MTIREAKVNYIKILTADVRPTIIGHVTEI